MNSIQMISRKLEAQRLKLQMGLDPSMKVDTHELRAMWRQLKVERLRNSRGANPERHYRAEA